MDILKIIFNNTCIFKLPKTLCQYRVIIPYYPTFAVVWCSWSCLLLSSTHRGKNTLQRHNEVRHKSIAGCSYIRACNRHPSTRPECYQRSAEHRGGGRNGMGGCGWDKREWRKIIMTVLRSCVLLKCFHVTDGSVWSHFVPLGRISAAVDLVFV